MKTEEVKPFMHVRVRPWDMLVEEFGVRSTGSVDCPYGFPRQLSDLCGKGAVVVGRQHPGDAFVLHFYGEEKPDMVTSFHASILEPIGWEDFETKPEEEEPPSKGGLRVVK